MIDFIMPPTFVTESVAFRSVTDAVSYAVIATSSTPINAPNIIITIHKNILNFMVGLIGINGVTKSIMADV
jgi:hypothetical protein